MSNFTELYLDFFFIIYSFYLNQLKHITQKSQTEDNQVLAFRAGFSALESSLHNLDEIEKDIAQKSLPAPTPNVLYGVQKNFK